MRSMNVGKNREENDSSYDDYDGEDDEQDAVEYSSC